MNAFIVSATESNSGKTLITSGLMKVLDELAQVRPFKAGPDYIDPMFHRFILKEPSYNLDLILCGTERTRYLFYSKLYPSDIAVVEGVMGLYDGVRWNNEHKGSTADLAKTLDVPVVLIVDGRGKSRSIAALVKGFLEFEPKEKSPKFAGILINRVRSEAVYQRLKEYIEESCEVPVLGWIPEEPEFHLESRHLGLLMPEEIIDLKEKISKMAAVIKRNVDLKKLLECTQKKLTLGDYSEEPIFSANQGKYNGLRIAVAYDEAFNFYYQDNLDLLKRLGVDLVYFSPLRDESLPEDLDALYLGGGYPEVYAGKLYKNNKLIRNIQRNLHRGLPCYAECGGQLYLSNFIVYQEKKMPLVDFLPIQSYMTDRLKNFGYSEMEVHDLLGRNYQLNIHEFHRSEVESKKAYPVHFTISKNGKIWSDGGLYKNTLFGYPHYHFYAQPDGPQFLIDILDYLKSRRTYDYC